MTLSEEDGKLFYKLWFPLLDYVNKTCKVNSKLGELAMGKNLLPNDVKEVANRLYDDVSLIDKYLAECRDMPEEHRQIISSWKRCIRGKFLMERHLKKGTILISLDNNEVYQSVGIISEWEEMFWYAPLPLVVDVALLPFREVIIPDGLIIPYNVHIGRNIAAGFKDIYMSAKKAGRIHCTL